MLNCAKAQFSAKRGKPQRPNVTAAAEMEMMVGKRGRSSYKGADHDIEGSSYKGVKL